MSMSHFELFTPLMVHVGVGAPIYPVIPPQHYGEKNPWPWSPSAYLLIQTSPALVTAFVAVCNT